MNLQCLLRKRELGIENLDDYIIWAESLLSAGEQLKSLEYLGSMEFGHSIDVTRHSNWTKDIRDAFDVAAIELNLNISDVKIDQSKEARCVREIYQECVRHNKHIYSIDLRVIQETDRSKDVLTLVDEMSCQCGGFPLGKLWREIDNALVERALIDVFLYSLGGGRAKTMPDSEARKLANRFRSHFSNEVRYFSNWGGGVFVGGGSSNKLLNSDSELIDFGLILVDDMRIGMIMLIG